MHAQHPDAVKLAAAAECDPRTAAKFLNGEHIRTHRVRDQLVVSARALKLKVGLSKEPDEASP